MKGYYRFPSIYKNKIVFVSDDDLWITDLKTSTTYRLTNNTGLVSSPIFSPNGKNIAYIGTEDGGTEIYLISSNGGKSARLTYEGGHINKISLWHNNDIYFSSNLDSPQRVSDLRKVDYRGGESTSLKHGMSTVISISKHGTIVGKNSAEPARWKRYKGGTAGELLIDINSTGNFKKFLNINGNITSPMWIEDKIYFISDHEGIGNIYKTTKSGKHIEKVTNHKNYYVRNCNTDGQSIVYHSGADIYVYSIANNTITNAKINFNSTKIQTSRKYANASSYLESYTLSNDKKFLNIVSRGKSFTFGNWNGSIHQHGIKDGVRYKHSQFCNDNKNLFIVSDRNNTENIELHSLSSTSYKTSKVNLGRIIDVIKSPESNNFAIVNHKHELHIYNSKTDKSKLIERSKHDSIDCNWSRDGKYIAYSCSINSRCSIIKIYDLKAKKSFSITKPINKDFSPVFDDSGNYLAFLSIRTFTPTYDNIQFDLSFQNGEKPYIVALSKNTHSPFLPSPCESKDKNDKSKKDTDKKKVTVKINFKDIDNRIMEIPIKENTFLSSIDFNDNKLYYISNRKYNNHDMPFGDLKFYDLKTREEKLFLPKVSSFNIYGDKILIHSNNSLRLIAVTTPPSKEILMNNKFNEKSGLINLNRIKLSINPIDEWKQMYSEAWRLQRDYFWVSNMSGINWNKVYKRYHSLIDRLSTRTEFSDLLWEMQGELGTSHCYEMGGDYKPRRNYFQGLIGADLEYNSKVNAYEIIKIYKGDVWKNPQSPLLRPGLNIAEGDLIKKINNENLTKKVTPGHLLVNETNSEVLLQIIAKKTNKKRMVTIKTLSDQKGLQYRDWVESNKDYVHKKSKNKIGYIHIPDMGVAGFSEFHRHYLSEISYDGLIIDVRYNGGGHISQLLLSKLARKRLGFDLTRWMGEEPYPVESPAGPMVAITNEFAGSDGDIFSHSWKMMKLGKLIGKRTWGGVIGIWPRNSLVDGTVTTQPEFSFWFKDVGWGVENYGAEVDIEIDNLPQDFSKGIDNQLDKGIEIVQNEMSKNGAILKPNFKDKPNLKLP
tara:strand:+ start:3978 stop:7130 length:3153 start_codon:yes stop_codon:yes gene_type:complete